MNFRQFLPHLVAILTFIILSFTYFYPVLEGYQLKQGDATNFHGMSKEIVDYRSLHDEEPLWTNSMFGGMPAYQISVKYTGNILKFVDQVIHLGLPRPVSFLFLYMAGFYLLMIALRVNPWIAAAGAVAFGLSTYFLIIIEAGHNTKANAIGYMAPALAGIIYTYRNKIFVGGALTALFLALQINANHVQITYYFGFLVLFLIAAVFYNRMKTSTTPAFFKQTGILALAAVLALVVNTNNLWNTYEYGKYTTRGKTDLTIEPRGGSNSENTTKGLDRDYVTQWSYGLGETWSLLIPDVKGGGTAALGNDPTVLKSASPQFRQNLAQSNRYWGNQPFTSGPVYVGASIILLFLLGIVYLKTPVKWALLATTILTVMLSWGSNYMGLTNFFLDYIPGYDKFRAVTIILAITELAIPISGFLFLRQLYKNPDLLITNKKPFYIVSGGIILVLIAFYGLPTTFFDFLSEQELNSFGSQMASGGEQSQLISSYLDNLEAVRISIFQSDVLRSLIFVIITALSLFMFSKKTIGLKLFAGILMVIVLLDLWPVNKRYLNNEKERGQYVQWEKKEESLLAFSPLPADEMILEIEKQRNPSLAESIESLAASLQTEFVNENNIKRKLPREAIVTSQLSALRFSTNYRVLQLGNPFNDARVSYFHKSVGGYHGAKLKRYQELIDFHLGEEINGLIQKLQQQSSASGVRRIFDESHILNMLNTKYIIYNPEAEPLTNPSALGSAWFVNEIEWAENADDEIIKTGTINTATTCVVDKQFESLISIQPDSADNSGYIQLESYLPNKLVYTTQTRSPQIAVFSEIFYQDGWQAYIDGNPVEHFRANYILRGMEIPAGEHQIEFIFDPPVYHTASTISMASSVLLILLVIAGIWFEGRRRSDPDPIPDEV